MMSALSIRSENLKEEQKILLKHVLQMSESLETINKNYKDRFYDIEQKYDEKYKVFENKLESIESIRNTNYALVDGKLENLSEHMKRQHLKVQNIFLNMETKDMKFENENSSTELFEKYVNCPNTNGYKRRNSYKASD